MIQKSKDLLFLIFSALSFLTGDDDGGGATSSSPSVLRNHITLSGIQFSLMANVGFILGGFDKCFQRTSQIFNILILICLRFSKDSRNLSVRKMAIEEKKMNFRKEKVKFHIYPQIPPKTNIYIPNTHNLVNTQVTSKFVRTLLIKCYKTIKSPFLLLWFHHFWKKKFTLLHKSSNFEILVEIWNKWNVYSNVAGFEGSNEPNNSILVSEWTGALW